MLHEPPASKLPAVCEDFLPMPPSLSRLTLLYFETLQNGGMLRRGLSLPATPSLPHLATLPTSGGSDRVLSKTGSSVVNSGRDWKLRRKDLRCAAYPPPTLSSDGIRPLRPSRTFPLPQSNAHFTSLTSKPVENIKAHARQTRNYS